MMNGVDLGPLGTGTIAPRSTKIRSISKATGEVLGETAVATHGELRLAVARARTAQVSWGALPPEERGRRILRFRDAVVERADEIVDLIVRETGKPRQEALVHEVAVTVEMLAYLARRAGSVLSTRTVSSHWMKLGRSWIQHVPRGVVAVIAPCDYPFQLPLRGALTALVAGNAVVLKPSERTPLVARKVKEIWDESGLSEDLLQVVYGYGDTAMALLDTGIDLVVFSGSTENGKRVAAACGERLIPCMMELSGKAPLIACSDADVERTARAIAFGAFSNAGQTCVSVERVYAHRDVHDKLVERVVALTRTLRQGDPTNEPVEVGAVVSEARIAVLEKLVRDAVQRGALIETGGRRRAAPGFFFEPTVLSRCDHSMPIMREEIFGPVVPFMRVSTDDESVRLSNESNLGLNAYVFTADRDHGRRLAERLEVGSVLVNDVLSNASTVDTPFGGLKQSGFGRTFGDDSLRSMCVVRHISVDRGALTIAPLSFPYDEGNYGWLRKGFQLFLGGGGLLRRLRDVL